MGNFELDLNYSLSDRCQKLDVVSVPAEIVEYRALLGLLDSVRDTAYWINCKVSVSEMGRDALRKPILACLILGDPSG